MVVSDAGLASTEPEWWNSSPIACMLIAVQPRGGWQVMQRAVQWGTDSWARSFGVSCKMPALYSYFACSMRNRLEVWDSQSFVSPMEGNEAALLSVVAEASNEKKRIADETVDEVTTLKSDAMLHPSDAKATVIEEVIDVNPVAVNQGSEASIEQLKGAHSQTRGDSSWKLFTQHNGGIFSIRRPTKLTDGSRGGQAFMCSLFCPEQGNAYSIEEQARLQFLSIVIVAAGLSKSADYNTFRHIMQEDFELSTRLGLVFKHLVRGLFVANLFVIGFIVSVFYALWSDNFYGEAAPYIIQLCSLTTWTFGATGLLMLGGNPRVEIDDGKSIPKHIQSRLDSLPSGMVALDFGSLHGSIYTRDRGSCSIHCDLLAAICGWNLSLSRKWGWGTAIMWFALHIGTSVALQVAGTRVATMYSQIMGIAVLVLTSVVRGRGVSGPEEWMIPRWRMRKGARYAVALQGQIFSRAK